MTEDPSLPNMTQSDIRKMLNDLDASNADRETLKQKCHELENHVNLLQDEKANISAEFEQLQSQVWYIYRTFRLDGSDPTNYIRGRTGEVYIHILQNMLITTGYWKRNVKNRRVRRWGERWRKSTNKTTKKAT